MTRLNFWLNDNFLQQLVPFLGCVHLNIRNGSHYSCGSLCVCVCVCVCVCIILSGCSKVI